MNTKILDPLKKEDIDFAGETLKNGGLICIPTETVYGLAADALNPEAVSEIYVVKGRPSDNPLIVHIADFDDIYPLVRYVPEKAKALAEKFWPGPLTIILPKSDIIPDKTSGGLDTVAVRFPSHPVAQAIIKASGKPLAAPSANLSGKPSPTEFRYCYEDLNGKIPGIVNGGDCDVGVESTVITLVPEIPKVLRPGGI
ncbi:MAG: L-threonylcarbamoyladenylate synthase, partial [Clostridia bacterium]|nr:L-threonylcarbamoyladenylate synthase [Clostridia bacterium]